MTSTKKEWLTPKEVAQRLGLHYYTILSWIRKGHLPTTKIEGSNRILINADALNAMLNPKSSK